MSPVVECWLPVVGFPGYEVSDLGRVRSFRVSKRVTIMVGKYEKQGGYHEVILRKDGGGQVSRRVHRLVIEAFVGGMEARHLNGNNVDNRACNLRWGTKRERQGSAKLTAERVFEALRLRETDGLSYQKLARRFGVAKATIRLAVKGMSWAHLKETA